MNEPQPKRHLKLHRSTWVVGGIVLFTMSVIVLPGSGESLEVILEGGANEPATLYRHGWPFVFQVSFHLTENESFLGIPWLSLDAWKLWQVEPDSFSLSHLLTDLAILIAIVVSVAAAWEWRRRRRQRIWQFNIADLLVVSSLVALLFGWFSYQRSQHARDGELALALEKHFDGATDIGVRNSTAAPLWLARLVGEQPFPTVDRYYLLRIVPGASDIPGTLAKARPLVEDLRYLTHLQVTLPAQDKDLLFQSIDDLPQIRYVTLLDNEYEGILDLELAKKIAQMQNLIRLELYFEHPVPADAKTLLATRMPNCTIHYANED